MKIILFPIRLFLTLFFIISSPFILFLIIFPCVDMERSLNKAISVLKDDFILIIKKIWMSDGVDL